MGKICVPKSVYESLESIRQSGATNMFDYAAVVHLAEMLNNQAAAHWLLDHKWGYLEGVLYGIEPAD